MEGGIFKDYKQKDIWTRSANVAIKIVVLTKRLSRNAENIVFTNQILRSSSSVGANLSEASAAYSKKEFACFVNIARREAVETDYWLRLIYRCNPEIRKDVQVIGEEYQEIIRVLSSIVRNTRIRG